MSSSLSRINSSVKSQSADPKAPQFELVMEGSFLYVEKTNELLRYFLNSKFKTNSASRLVEKVKKKKRERALFSRETLLYVWREMRALVCLSANQQSSWFSRSVPFELEWSNESAAASQSALLLTSTPSQPHIYQTWAGFSETSLTPPAQDMW